MTLEVDYALVGGGLQNGLLALALGHAQPSAKIAIVERGPTLGGNHTWCFHAGDVPAAAQPWFAPLIAHRWPGYDVCFPLRRRHVAAEYGCVTSARLHELVSARPQLTLLLEHEVTRVLPHRVSARGPGGALVELAAAAVIDARGPALASESRAAYQKFVGLEVELAAPHHLSVPLLMDATCEQLDGFRFLYVLPLGERRLLVEDTYFSTSPLLELEVLRQRCRDACAARGWAIARELREERGVLPLPLDDTEGDTGDGDTGDADQGSGAKDADSAASARAAGLPLRAGYGGGWFHPVTGYSLPIAVRLALAVAATPPAELPGPQVAALAARHRKQRAFAHRLNAMMFRWFPDAQRFRVLEHFYRLPEPLIRRFYALELTAADRLRIFLGRPPRGMSWRAALGLRPSPSTVRTSSDALSEASPSSPSPLQEPR